MFDIVTLASFQISSFCSIKEFLLGLFLSRDNTEQFFVLILFPSPSSLFLTHLFYLSMSLFLLICVSVFLSFYLYVVLWFSLHTIVFCLELYHWMEGVRVGGLYLVSVSECVPFISRQSFYSRCVWFTLILCSVCL